MMRTLSLVEGCALAGSPAFARQPAPFVLGGHSVAPGSVQHVDLPVPAGADPATYVPITVFHGAKPGPVLAITAGVHAYEFPPILAAQALLERIEPAQLSGTVILVRMANVNARRNSWP